MDILVLQNFTNCAVEAGKICCGKMGACCWKWRRKTRRQYLQWDVDSSQLTAGIQLQHYWVLSSDRTNYPDTGCNRHNTLQHLLQHSSHSCRPNNFINHRRNYIEANREDQPRCAYCDCALTVVHILLECPNYSIVRQRYFSATTLKDLFETVKTHTILDFIKEIGFYNRI